jgi:hypothetical protein
LQLTPWFAHPHCGNKHAAQAIELVHGQAITYAHRHILQFGEIDIDSQLVVKQEVLEGSQDSITQLSNGCLCCTVRDDLIAALNRLVSEQRVVQNQLCGGGNGTRACRKGEKADASVRDAMELCVSMQPLTSCTSQGHQLPATAATTMHQSCWPRSTTAATSLITL